MQFSRKQIFIIVGAVLAIGLVYILFTSGSRNANKPPEIALKVWGVDDRRVFDGVISAYGALRSNVHVTYEQIPAANYRETVLNALASGSGPDVFMVPNQSIPRYADKLVPVNKAQINVSQLENLFPTAVSQDFVQQGDIYALPFYIDTLALIYNRDALDGVALTLPPKTWTDVQRYVPYLRATNASGQLTRSAVAIGGTERTIKNAADILILLMMQGGVKLNDVAMSRVTLSGNTQAQKALNFYLQFANTVSPSYTWNEEQPYSSDSIASGRTAMIFGYYADYVDLQKKNPFVNLAVASMPQLEGATQAVNISRYSGLAVSKQAKAQNQPWAWDFIVQSATSANIAKLYAEATGRLPALRSLIAEKVNDEKLGLFAKQALTARSWYVPDEEKAREILSNAIGDVLRGQSDTLRALRKAEEQINQIDVFHP